MMTPDRELDKIILEKLRKLERLGLITISINADGEVMSTCTEKGLHFKGHVPADEIDYDDLN